MTDLATLLDEIPEAARDSRVVGSQGATGGPLTDASQWASSSSTYGGQFAQTVYSPDGRVLYQPQFRGFQDGVFGGFDQTSRFKMSQAQIDRLFQGGSGAGSGGRKGLLDMLKDTVMVTLKAIDLPRAAVTSTLKETIDLAQGEGFSFGDLYSQTRDSYGFGELIQEELPGLGEVEIFGMHPLDNIAGFMGEVLLDPFTYLTFGTLTAARMGSVGLARAAVRGGDNALAARLFRQGLTGVDANDMTKLSELTGKNLSGGLQFTVPGTGSVAQRVAGRARGLEAKHLQILPQSVVKYTPRGVANRIGTRMRRWNATRLFNGDRSALRLKLLEGTDDEFRMAFIAMDGDNLFRGVERQFANVFANKGRRLMDRGKELGYDGPTVQHAAGSDVLPDGMDATFYKDLKELLEEVRVSANTALRKNAGLADDSADWLPHRANWQPTQHSDEVIAEIAQARKAFDSGEVEGSQLNKAIFEHEATLVEGATFMDRTLVSASDHAAMTGRKAGTGLTPRQQAVEIFNENVEVYGQEAFDFFNNDFYVAFPLHIKRLSNRLRGRGVEEILAQAGIAVDSWARVADLGSLGGVMRRANADAQVRRGMAERERMIVLEEARQVELATARQDVLDAEAGVEASQAAVGSAAARRGVEAEGVAGQIEYAEALDEMADAEAAIRANMEAGILRDTQALEVQVAVHQAAVDRAVRARTVLSARTNRLQARIGQLLQEQGELYSDTADRLTGAVERSGRMEEIPRELAQLDEMLARADNQLLLSQYDRVEDIEAGVVTKDLQIADIDSTLEELDSFGEIWGVIKRNLGDQQGAHQFSGDLDALAQRLNLKPVSTYRRGNVSNLSAYDGVANEAAGLARTLRTHREAQIRARAALVSEIEAFKPRAGAAGEVRDLHVWRGELEREMLHLIEQDPQAARVALENLDLPVVNDKGFLEINGTSELVAVPGADGYGPSYRALKEGDPQTAAQRVSVKADNPAVYNSQMDMDRHAIGLALQNGTISAEDLVRSVLRQRHLYKDARKAEMARMVPIVQELLDTNAPFDEVAKVLARADVPLDLTSILSRMAPGRRAQVEKGLRSWAIAQGHGAVIVFTPPSFPKGVVGSPHRIGYNPEATRRGGIDVGGMDYRADAPRDAEGNIRPLMSGNSVLAATDEVGEDVGELVLNPHQFRDGYTLPERGVKEAEPEDLRGLDLDEGAARPRSDVALDPETGEVSPYADFLEIGMIQTHPEQVRKGIAEAMVEEAEQQFGVPVFHSDLFIEGGGGFEFATRTGGPERRFHPSRHRIIPMVPEVTVLEGTAGTTDEMLRRYRAHTASLAQAMNESADVMAAEASGLSPIMARTTGDIADAKAAIVENRAAMGRLRDEIDAKQQGLSARSDRSLREEWALRQDADASRQRAEDLQTIKDGHDAQAVQGALDVQAAEQAEYAGRVAHVQRLVAEAEQVAADLEATQGHLMGLDEMLRKLPKSMDEVWRFEDVLKRGYERIGADQRQVPDWMAEGLKDVNKIIGRADQSKVLKHVDAVTNLFKSWAIATPGFHMRNFFGGVFNNALGGVDGIESYARFRRYYKPVAKVLKRGGTVDEAVAAMRRANAKGKWNDQMEEVVRSGLLTDGQGADVTRDIVGSSSRSFSAVNPFNPSNKYVNTMHKGTHIVENHLRGTMALDRMVKGGSIDDAVSDVFKFHFDYEDLSGFERGVARRVIPFYTWTRKNLPLQLEMMMTNPKIYNRVGAAKRNIEQGVEEEEIVPQWYLDRFNIHLPFQLGQGADIYFTPDLPFTQLTEMLDVKKLVSQTNPLIKAPLERLAGKQFFSDQQFHEVHRPLPRGLEIALYPALPALSALGVVAYRDDGQPMILQKDQVLMETFMPVLAQMRRLVPDTNTEGEFGENQRDTIYLTWANWTFGSGLRINNAYAQSGEERRRRRDEQATAQLQEALAS